MTPLIVTAHTPGGYTRSDDWSPALDGILAYWALRDQLGEEEFALGMSGHRELVEPAIPLAREEWSGTWWYQCSSPADQLMAVHERHIHRRFDDQHERYLRDGIRRVETSAGPYKAYRIRRQLRIAPWVRWYAVGDQVEVERLLRRCAFIGNGSTHGSGEVTRWEVAPGDSTVAVAARFSRPLPAGFAAANGVQGMEMRYGIRPPGRAPEHQMECVMP